MEIDPIDARIRKLCDELLVAQDQRSRLSLANCERLFGNMLNS